MPRHNLTKNQKKPRSVECRECGKKCKIIGYRTLPLCKTHRKEYDAGKIERAKEKRLRKIEERKAGSLGDLRRVQDSGPSTLQASPETMRETPNGASQRERTPKEKTLAGRHDPAKQTKRVDCWEAWELISQPEREREGFRHGWIGNTGTGKTTAMRKMLTDMPPTLTLIHDDAKLDAQYPGAVVEKIEDAPNDAQAVVFRGDVYQGIVVPPEYVAELTVRISRAARQPVRILIDELDRACSLGGKTLDAPSLRVCMTQGRSLGISVTWSTQTPQRTPTEIIDQSSTIGFFQLGPRALNYLDERLCLERDILDTIPKLEKFEFVVYEQGKPWNGKVYFCPWTGQT